MKARNAKPSPPSRSRCLEGTKTVGRKTTRELAENSYLQEAPDRPLLFGKLALQRLPLKRVKMDTKKPMNCL